MSDQFRGQPIKRSDPADSWFTITPGAGVLPLRPRMLFCSAPGNATMEGGDGTSVSFTGFVAGEIYELSPVKVTAATATLIGLV